MLNIGGGEVLVIFIMALIFLGPARLPTAARQIGKAIADFRRVTSGVQQDLKDALDVDGVRESLDTFREVADVRRTLVSEITSAANVFASPLAPSTRTSTEALVDPLAGTGSPSVPPVGDATVPPPDGMFLGDRSENDLAGGVAVPSPAAPKFRDVLVDDLGQN